jgi:hypothetical protein
MHAIERKPMIAAGVALWRAASRICPQFAGSTPNAPGACRRQRLGFRLRPGEIGPAEAKWGTISKVAREASTREGYAQGRRRASSPVAFSCRAVDPASQDSLQPPANALDLAHVIRGVIDAERGAIEHYSRIIEVTNGVDPVTQDMLTTILADEQNHLRTFEGFLREYEAERA